MQRALIIIGLVLLVAGIAWPWLSGCLSAGCGRLVGRARLSFFFARHLDRRVDRDQPAHLAVPQM
jgi:hypothetical protein